MNCPNCQNPIQGEKFCPNCGQSTMTEPQPQVEQPPYQDTEETPYQGQPYPNQAPYGQPYGQPYGNPYGNPYPPAPVKDEPDFLIKGASCCVPLIGIIFYFMWKDQKPLSSKAAGKWALIGFLSGFLFYFGYFILILFSSILFGF